MRTAQPPRLAHRRDPHRPRRRRPARPRRPTGRCGSGPTSTSTPSSRLRAESGAGYVHPGYGFLSERAPFARALADAGITLVGPSADVMDAMGRKDAAREVAVAAGVPVVPSYSLDGRPGRPSPTRCWSRRPPAAAARACASCARAGDYDEAFAAAQREARSSFGDDTILVEKYVESGRHIEVQVIGDTHGTVAPLLRARLLHAAPAPEGAGGGARPDDQRRAARGDHVVGRRAGRAVRLHRRRHGRVPARQRDRRVLLPRDEHPPPGRAPGHRGGRPGPTAAASGRPRRAPAARRDRRAAAASPRTPSRSRATRSRPASTPRTPSTASCPQAGRTSIVQVGVRATRVRVDHALEPEQEVSTSYDPMLGKVIAWGADREAARAALVDALGETAILGITTNTGFLRALAASDEFRDATIDTAWLDRHEVPGARRRRWRGSSARGPRCCSTPRPTGTARPVAGRRLADGRRARRRHGRPRRRARGRRPAPRPRRARRHHPRRTHGRRPRDHTVHLLVDGRAEHAVLNVQRDVVEVVHRGQRWVWERPDPFADHAAGGRRRHAARADARHRPRGQRRRGPGRGRG